MSTYWTEHVVTTIKRRYYKGKFTGKFYSDRLEGDDGIKTELYKIHIYEAEVAIEDGDTRSDEEGDFPEVKNIKALKVSFNSPIKCFDKKFKVHFLLETDKLIVDNPTLSHIIKDGKSHCGSITGTLYGSLSKTIFETIRTEHTRIEAVPRSNTEKPVIDPDIKPATQFLNPLPPVTQQPPITPPTPAEDLRAGCSCLPILGGLLTAFFLLLAVISLISIWPIVLGIVLLIALNFFFTFFKIGWIHAFFNWLFGLVLLLGLLFLAISGLNLLTRHLPSVPRPHPPIILIPDTTTKKPSVDTIAIKIVKASWITHHCRWSDLDGRTYSGIVRVKKSLYLKSQAEHESYLTSTPLPEVYSAFNRSDENKLDSVYSLFDSLKIARHLDRLQFAGMLVSFVQNIKYASVTEGPCMGNLPSNNNPSGLNEATNCIGNISFGVQSPLEFMGNFKGDCDTRTVFLFTLFNHYQYHVAILGSNAFKHSLLGIDLPLPGISKILGSSRFVLWETTSIGFAPGCISPEINYMDYWQFDLVNTPTS